ncbi:hypothetical protein F4677DRAFT_409704 [Hypoxylon crocopeplum]|nr:hypothetical protein F4677DRAFT_409704 [Hypoxylon crocopeplum]
MAGSLPSLDTISRFMCGSIKACPFLNRLSPSSQYRSRPYIIRVSPVRTPLRQLCKMGLTDAAIIGLVGVLIACVPAVPFLYRACQRLRLARRGYQSIQNRTPFARFETTLPVAGSYLMSPNSDPTALFTQPSWSEDSTLYRTFYCETTIVRPAATANSHNPLSRPILQTNTAHGAIEEI